MTKQERLEEFLRRLEAAPAASSAQTAFDLLAEKLNEVEDEFSGVPYAPDRWINDGRMYPPQADSARNVADRPNLTRYRSKGHNTLIGSNGSIRIETLGKILIFEKQGADGKGIDDI